jgi:hypothetical protein
MKFKDIKEGKYLRLKVENPPECSFMLILKVIAKNEDEMTVYVLKDSDTNLGPNWTATTSVISQIEFSSKYCIWEEIDEPTAILEAL